MKVRNVSFDYAKGIGIVVVVFAHLWRGLQGAGLLSMPETDFFAISSSCTVWSMPAFFFVSGVLYGRGLDKRHGLPELAGKFDGIFYPYVIWSLIVGAFEVLGSGYRNGSTSVSSLLTILWEPRGIFWFLYALFEAFVLVEVMVFLVGVTKARWLVVPVAVLLLLLWEPRQLPFSLSEFQMSFIYFAVGVLIAPRMQMDQRVSWPMALTAGAALIGILYLSHVVFGIRTASFRSVTPNATAVALLVLGVFLLFCYSLPRMKLEWLARLGERSMDVYLLHLLLIAPIRIVMQKIFHVENPIIYMALGLPFGILGALFMADALKKIKLGFLFSPPAALSLKARLTSRRAALQIPR
ncbi:MAG: acyltransferase family protein [Acidobacteriota bacterium]